MLAGSHPTGGLQPRRHLLKISTASCRQSRRLLECMEDNFLRHVMDSPTRGDAILDLMVTDASELIGDVKIGGSLGCSDDALVELAVVRDMAQAKSKVRTLNFRKAKCQLFKELVNRTPWETALREEGAEQGTSDLSASPLCLGRSWNRSS